MEKEDKEEYQIDYKVDVRQTFYANFMWLWMTGIVVMFILLGFGKMPEFKDETIKLLYMIVMLFVTVKLLAWMGGPHLRLRIKQESEK